MTGHAGVRAAERLTEAGVPTDAASKMVQAAIRYAETTHGSVAVLVATLKGQVGEAWSDRSNGNQVWAIIREGRVVTMMLRRSTQPATPEAMSVDRVVIPGRPK